MQSKAGIVFLAHEYAREMGRQGIISVVRTLPTREERQVSSHCILVC